VVFLFSLLIFRKEDDSGYKGCAEIKKPHLNENPDEVVG
jgi:hypothetical protein